MQATAISPVAAMRQAALLKPLLVGSAHRLLLGSGGGLANWVSAVRTVSSAACAHEAGCTFAVQAAVMELRAVQLEAASIARSMAACPFA